MAHLQAAIVLSEDPKPYNHSVYNIGSTDYLAGYLACLFGHNPSVFAAAGC